MDRELLELDAVGEAEAIRTRKLSALELTDAYFARIDRIDGALRSYVSLDREGARRAAAAIDNAPKSEGLLAGATFSIKDVDDMAGLPTTHSCDLLADNIAERDDPVVRRFREAGLVLLGKTNVPEFCSSMTGSRLNGICRNPWNTELSPSGSSGGAAAAAAARLCSAAHGTDGAGSVRGPAAFCGLVGLKTTRGLVSFGPMEGPAYYGTSGPGVLTRSVRDAAALLDVLAPRDDVWTPTRPRNYFDEIAVAPAPLRIAFTLTAPGGGEVDDKCAQAVKATARLLESLGHAVEEATPAWADIFAGATLPMSVPGAAALIDLADMERVEPRNVPMVQRMATLTVLEHAGMVDAARAATRRFITFWDKYDVLVTPASGKMQPPAEEIWHLDPQAHNAKLRDFPTWLWPFNISGQPAVSLPLGWSAEGLPIGVQFAGGHLGEATLLRLAAQLEQALPWAKRLNDLAASL
jgi:amidase